MLVDRATWLMETEYDMIYIIFIFINQLNDPLIPFAVTLTLYFKVQVLKLGAVTPFGESIDGIK